MALIISTRNAKSQPEIFLSETPCPDEQFLKWGMGKQRPHDTPEIFLGAWLELYEIGATEAAGIAGCTQSYISNISRGAKKNVNVLYLLRLSEHMHISVNDFFRKPPSRAQMAPFAALSPAARVEILARKQRKA